ncbi:branched-chain amino acid transport system II carrier protein [Ectobacillus polymachus]|uniref:branched-chain amino acid transport system II carrier protein n=1 Tax=Ectobacillus polymachus TaxID=1508806 RepID=UPI003A849F6C
MKLKDIFAVGLMLFSMFFGAGNLIFPPFLGMNAGTSFWPAIIGFVVTGVGLPFLVLAAISLVKGGVQALGSRVHPLFGFIFTLIVYLSIGPFFGIPRNANVAFEMGLMPFVSKGMNHSLLLFGYTILFFTLVYFVSMNPSKIVNYMGRLITPTLLVAIAFLCGVAFFNLHAPLAAPTASYTAGPFFKGFIDGYSTLDALAALAFGIVIMNTLQRSGIKGKKALTAYTIKAGLVAGSALSIVYITIGWLGALMSGQGTFKNGTDLLGAASNHLLGLGGTVLLGFIFTLACFSTCVGLTTACGQFFSELTNKVSYKTFVTIVTIGSFLIANLGLNQIIAISVPFLEMAYPLTIVLVVLVFITSRRKVYGCAILLTGIVSVYDGLKAFLPLQSFGHMMDVLPLSAYGLGWVLPAIVGALLGFLWDKLDKKHTGSSDELQAS